MGILEALLVGCIILSILGYIAMPIWAMVLIYLGIYALSLCLLFCFAILIDLISNNV